MNRKRRKAAKMFKRKYGRATFPFWQRQPQTEISQEALRKALTDVYNRCTKGGE